MNILFAGCGDIATRTASVLAGRADCSGIRRQAHKIPAGIKPFAADLCAPDSLHVVEQNFDYIVVTLTPSGRTEQDYQRAYVDASEHLLQWIRQWDTLPKRVFFVSSTSVYGQQDHSEVTEQSPTRSDGTAGRLVAAEDVWRHSGLATTVLRLSGIYGDQRRYFLTQVMAGTVASDGLHYSNRIHIDDVARAVAFLIEQDSQQALADCYIVSDQEPVPLNTVVEWLQRQLPQASSASGNTFKRRGGSKRCSSQALQALGFDFHYPTFREGYMAMLIAQQ